MRANDSNYIKRLKSGKEDALEFIVDKYLPLVKGITYKILLVAGNTQAMEECINDVFLSVWENSNKFNGEDTDFRRWICAIAKFKAIDYYRKANRNMDVAVELVDDGFRKLSKVNISENSGVFVNSAEDEVIIKEDKNELIELINQLEPMDRDIFIMKFFLGEKSEDIARKFNVTRASIDNRIYRGKKKLRDGKEKLIMEVI